jgi:hypothetical protein
MPGVPGINERPASVHSAQHAPAQRTKKVVVHYRSDTLMSEQVRGILETGKLHLIYHVYKKLKLWVYSLLLLPGHA